MQEDRTPDGNPDGNQVGSYLLLDEPKSQSITNVVNEYLAVGWRLKGSTFPVVDRGHVRYHQAMVHPLPPDRLIEDEGPVSASMSPSRTVHDSPGQVRELPLQHAAPSQPAPFTPSEAPVRQDQVQQQDPAPVQQQEQQQNPAPVQQQEQQQEQPAEVPVVDPEPTGEAELTVGEGQGELADQLPESL